MSFIGSILASISGDEQALSASTAATQPNATKPKKSKTPSANGLAGTAAPKRKAEGDLNSLPLKARRTGPQAAPPRLTGQSHPTASTDSPRTPITPTVGLTSYRGTAHSAPQATSVAKTGSRGTNARVASSPATPIQPPNPAAKGAPATAASVGQKKGSYLEILARAKAAQQAKGPVGAIKHKPVERLTKKERLAQLAEAKKTQLVGKDRKAPLNGVSRAIGTVDGKLTDTADRKKKAVNIGYQGTMRSVSAEPGYKGTMNRGIPEASSRKPPYGKDGDGRADKGRSTHLPARAKDKARHNGYASYSDEELDEEEEEEDYESDVSSAMEAGAFDLDLEEERSLRAAKKEDEDALREENELKRQKDARKRMLAKMAADAAKRKRL